jgi:hypothetical protein
VRARVGVTQLTCVPLIDIEQTRCPSCMHALPTAVLSSAAAMLPMIMAEKQHACMPDPHSALTMFHDMLKHMPHNLQRTRRARSRTLRRRRRRRRRRSRRCSTSGICSTSRSQSGGCLGRVGG